MWLCLWVCLCRAVLNAAVLCCLKFVNVAVGVSFSLYHDVVLRAFMICCYVSLGSNVTPFGCVFMGCVVYL